jgi:hypothetical protein
MSSGPVGLDVKEYGYNYFTFLASDGALHTFDANNNWLITKIQVFAGANPVTFIAGEGAAIVIAANGCLVLEPNGALRGIVEMQGSAGLIVIEFWYQSPLNGAAPTVTVT